MREKESVDLIGSIIQQPSAETSAATRSRSAANTGNCSCAVVCMISRSTQSTIGTAWPAF